MEQTALERVRSKLMSMGDVTERASHGEPAWFFKDKRQIAMWADRHHDDRVALWCAAPRGIQEALVESEPERYFRPPYVGHRGWIGVYFDVEPDWETVDRILGDAYDLISAKK